MINCCFQRRNCNTRLQGALDHNAAGCGRRNQHPKAQFSPELAATENFMRRSVAQCRAFLGGSYAALHHLPFSPVQTGPGRCSHQRRSGIFFSGHVSSYFYTRLKSKQESGVFGPAGLFSGDHVVSLDHCLVREKSSWRSCLYKTAKQAQTDFCLPATFISGKTHKSPDVPCCSAEMSSHLCFTGKDLAGEKLRSGLFYFWRNLILNVSASTGGAYEPGKW